MLFFQWSGSAGYWLLHSPHPWMVGAFLMNIGGCNNFILSTDAERLLIQLSSGCQWRLIASGCGKLIPEEMCFICFSNSGKILMRRFWAMYEGQKMAGTFAGSVAHPQVGGSGCMEHPAQCIQLIDPSFSMHSSLSISLVRSSLVDRQKYLYLALKHLKETIKRLLKLQKKQGKTFLFHCLI